MLEEAQELERQVEAEPAAEDIRAELGRLAELIEGIAQRFDLALAVRERDALDQLQFWSAVWWTRVLDCRSSSLAAVGPVDPALGVSLDKAVDEIAGQLMRIKELSSRRS